MAEDHNNRWLYESLVPSHITDPTEREAYIQKLMQSGLQFGATQKGDDRLDYFTE